VNNLWKYVLMEEGGMLTIVDNRIFSTVRRIYQKEINRVFNRVSLWRAKT